MLLLRYLGILCCLLGLLLGSLLGLSACGNSKSGFDPGPIPNFGKRTKPVPDKDTLTLKDENLKLTHFTQTWKLNTFNQDAGAEKYLRLQKVYPFPIQFNGWVTLDNVENTINNCTDNNNDAPEFYLEDDHNGSVFLRPGEKVQVNLEKLYEVRVEFPNQGLCKSVGIQFGVLYGTNE